MLVFVLAYSSNRVVHRSCESLRKAEASGILFTRHNRLGVHHGFNPYQDAKRRVTCDERI